MALVDIAKNTDYDVDRTHGTREVVQYIKENGGAEKILCSILQNTKYLENLALYTRTKNQIFR